MQISLLNRFEGGLLGSAIALELPEISSTFAHWSKIQDCAITTLIQTGKLETQDWYQHIEHCDRTLLERQKTGTSSEISALLLPLILFFHDLQAYLNTELSRVASLWLHPEESLEEILLWGEAIASILREPCYPSQILPWLLSHYPTQANLFNPLQEAIEGGLSLQQTVRMFNSHSPAQKNIALAFYCFSFTPEDFSLCWFRTQQLASQFPLVTLLTSAIAGLYNGAIAFPPSWCLSPQRQQILANARLLFAAWSGCYTGDRHYPLSQTAIGAAGTLQPRNGFATISQRQPRAIFHSPKS